MSSFIKRGSSRRSEDTMDDDDKDDTKRKSRNLSEKKRRDQFNMLINELSSMVSATSRKMDKSTVLKSTISYIRNHNEIAVRSRAHEIQEEWKPSFLSNEEFTHLILEALDGFIMVFSCSGRIVYASESITSLLGHIPSELQNTNIYDLTYEADQTELYNVLLNQNNSGDTGHYPIDKENQISFMCHLKRGGLEFTEELTYELVQFVGYFRSDVDSTEVENVISSSNSFAKEPTNRLVFVGTGRLQTPQLIREMSIVDSSKNEFTSRHSLEWKFLFLDHRAPPIIGYLPFEVLGTSGYDYYHIDDLEKVVVCHEALMQKGEGTSCYYRFLTKGQQWLWLQTRYYITYHQWNSKPEFIVCTHSVVSYAEVMRRMREPPGKDETEGREGEEAQASEEEIDDEEGDEGEESGTDAHPSATVSQSGLPASWSPSKSSVNRSPRYRVRSVDGSPTRITARGNASSMGGGPGSDCTSVSADSPVSRHSQITALSNRTARTTPVPAPQRVITTGYQHYQATSSQLVPHTSSQLVPTQQFAVTAIPVQSAVLATPFTSQTVVSTLASTEMVRQPLMVAPPQQNHIQEQLQRKHAEIQQLIVQQQEELRRVSEQLLMVRYGLPSVINVTVPYSHGGVVTSSTAALSSVASSSSELLYAQGRTIAATPAVYAPTITHTDYGIHDQMLGGRSDETIPFQLSQQQAQLLFTSGIGMPPQPPNQ